MKVYQIIISGEEGQTFAHDIFWHKSAAEKFMEELIEKSDYMYCSFRIDEKEVRE